MYPSFEVDEIYEKQNAPEGDFFCYRKPSDVPIICLPGLLKKHVI